ncbi:MAG: hypothetical protein M1827_001880 [Pycnora praestabilis]|nr:MAG: hypothetical protein M1827_001880 [Pycnora praestabilis]
MAEYPKTARNTINRYKGRGQYDYDTIHGLVNSCPILSVSFNSLDAEDPFPTILPMIGVMGSFAAPSSAPSEGRQDLYLHGYVSSRLMRLPLTDEKKGELDEEGTPLCVSATHLDGLVLALTPNHHSLNYRSAVLYGYATLVTSEKEKLYVMELITNNLIPNRWGNSRVPPTKVEFESTSILRVSIVTASAKVRTGGPGEDKADQNDPAVRARVWNGVVPVMTTLGTPIPAEDNKLGIPSHVKELMKVWNKDSQDKVSLASILGKVDMLTGFFFLALLTGMILLSRKAFL